MKIRKVEETDKEFPIKELFDTLVETLKDYIPSGADLKGILEDWEDTVEEGEDQSNDDIALHIPVKIESTIDFLISPKVGCTVDKDFTVPYARVHLYDVSENEDSYEIMVTLPSIGNLLDYFCGEDRNIEYDYVFEEWIDDVNKAKKFATDVKTYLDEYTKDLNIIFNSLKEIDQKSYGIWKILYKRGLLR